MGQGDWDFENVQEEIFTFSSSLWNVVLEGGNIVKYF